MAYPFRPAKVPVVIDELEIKRRRRKEKTDPFSDTNHPSKNRPTRLRKKLHVFSRR